MPSIDGGAVAEPARLALLKRKLEALHYMDFHDLDATSAPLAEKARPG